MASELTSRHFLAWPIENKVDLNHIQPGKPIQNSHVESFHGRLRDECLNASCFSNLSMRDGRSSCGVTTTTANGRIPACAIERQRNLCVWSPLRLLYRSVSLPSTRLKPKYAGGWRWCILTVLDSSGQQAIIQSE